MDIQGRIASRVAPEDRFCLRAVAGVDQAFMDDQVLSAAVVLDGQLALQAESGCRLKTAFPYRPGFLCFREGPAAIKAVRSLPIVPSLLFVDGCGINHPRRAGLACFVGIALNLPVIGVSKNVLCGSFDMPENEGDASPLVHQGDLVGYVLKSARKCRPIVIGPGHRISPDSALEVTRRFLRGHKLPEPCRLAHQRATKLRADLLRAGEASL